MKRTWWWVLAGVIVGWAVVVGVLLQQDFFGLFQPDDLGRWRTPPAPAFVAPTGMDDPVAQARALVEQELPEEEPAYTIEQAEAIAARVTPMVERACGREFAARPRLRVARRPDLALSLARTFMKDVETRLPNARSPYMNIAADEWAVVHSAAILGLYDPQDKVLLLAAGNVGPLMDVRGVARRHLEPLVTLIIAHELTHALQDQAIDLSTPRPLEHLADARLAFHCVLEGHAVFVEDMVGMELGLDEALLENSRMLSAGAATPPGSVFDMVERVDAVQFEQIYLGGRDFVAWHHRSGGPQRIWEILAAPPAQTSMISEPETYSPQATSSLDWYLALRDLDDLFGPDWDIDNNASLSAFDLHAIYAGLDRDQRQRLVASLEHVQVIDFRESLMRDPRPVKDWDSAGRAALYLVALRNQDDAAPFFAALRQDQDSDPEIEGYPRNLEGIQADEWECVSRISDGRTFTRLHARRGRIFCDLRLSGDGASDEALGVIVNSILDRGTKLAGD